MKGRLLFVGGGTFVSRIVGGYVRLGQHHDSLFTTVDHGGSAGDLRRSHDVIAFSDGARILGEVAGPNACKEILEIWDHRIADGVMRSSRFSIAFFTSKIELYRKMHPYASNAEISRLAFESAIRMLDAQAHVIPATYDNGLLRAKFTNGLELDGEDRIDEARGLHEVRIESLELVGECTANPLGIAKIGKARGIILAGDLFTSIAPVLLVPKIAEAIQVSRAPLIFVANLKTRSMQTTGYTVVDHIEKLEELCRRPINGCVVNNNTNYPASIERAYTHEGAENVINDVSDRRPDIEVVEADLWDRQKDKQQGHDPVKRSSLMHNGVATARAIDQLKILS